MKKFKIGKEQIFKYNSDTKKWERVKNAYSRDINDGVVVDHNADQLIPVYMGSGYTKLANSSPLEFYELNHYYHFPKIETETETADPYILQRTEKGIVHYRNFDNLLLMISDEVFEQGQLYYVAVAFAQNLQPHRNYTINSKMNDLVHFVKV